MGKFDNKIVIVTGAGQGIGYAITEQFAKEGATVIAIGRTLSKVEHTAELLKDYKVVPYCLDCGIEEQWKEVIQYIKDNYGSLDVLVNCAGIEMSKDILTQTFDEFKDVFKCNVDSIFLGMKYCYEVLKKGENSSIINISSVSSKKTGFNCGNDGSYSASKAAVNLLTRHAAFHFAKDRIRVNAVLPGGVKTAMVDDFLNNTPNAEEVLASMNPLPPHLADTKDIANCVLFLASDESNCTTGSEFIIDCGMLTT